MNMPSALITPSSLALLWVFRTRLTFGAALCAFVIFLSGFGPESDFYPVITAGAAVVTLCFMRLHGHLHRMSMIFPISDRQAAWFPMAIAALLWSAGLTGLILSQGLQAYMNILRFSVFTEHWLNFFPLISFTVFMTLAALRAVRVSDEWGFLAFVPFIAYGQITSLRPIFSSFGHLGALFIAVSLLLILEAPTHWATLRQQGISPSAKSGEPNPDPDAPTIIQPISLLSDTLLLLFLTPLAFPLAFGLIGNLIPYFQHPSLFLHQPAIIALLVLCPTIYAFFKRIYIQIRASGFSPLTSFLLFAMRLTLVLSPLVTALGVQRGQPVKCFFCGQWMLIWQTRCPHCQAQSPIHKAVMVERPAQVGSFHMDPTGYFYWFVIPFQILFMLFIN